MSTPGIWIAHPPYQEWCAGSEAEVVGDLGGDPTLGTVLGVEGGLARDAARVGVYEETARGLLRSLPWVPLVLRVADSRAADIHVMRLAGALGFSAVVGDDENLPDALRQDLCNVPRRRALTTFVHTCFPDAQPAVRDEASRLLVAGVEGSPAPRLSAPAGAARAKRMHRDGLPAPGRLLRSGKLLHVVLAIQRNPTLDLLTLALGCGYSSGSSLGRALRRRFGVGVNAIRPTLGWQLWLFCALCGEGATFVATGYRVNSDAEASARVA